MADIDYERLGKEKIENLTNKIRGPNIYEGLGACIEVGMGTYFTFSDYATGGNTDMIFGLPLMVFGIPLIVDAIGRANRVVNANEYGKQLKGYMQEAGILDKPEE